ncbi:SCO7613 C-terminal domain-containing membrane protein [Motilibacter aurantiacus]|uniref:SCO7613 C-terminal domain-containing membrane protein n=1 Tax=Motilibacter aurantiacus TaxID=2714955 RepID=UPI0014080289|nr:hypothetical protein [Motilibacter aurantiacus]NHC43867.1 hypothetical protein [Motilibacter aurantiacus]
MIDATLLEALTDRGRCPECAAGLPAGLSRCPRCGLPLAGDAAVRVWELSLRAAAVLTARRDAIAELRHVGLPAPATSTPVTSPPAPATPAHVPAPVAEWAGPGLGSPPGAPPRPVREPSGRGVQQLLVGLGALLLAVAAVIFAVVSWDLVGVGGRGLILAGTTAAAVAVAELARARRLPATAEALGAVAVVMAVLDAWAAYRVGLLGVDAVPGARYGAVACLLLALLCGGWARLRSGAVPEAAAGLLSAAAVACASVDTYAGGGVAGSALVLALGGAALVAAAARPVLLRSAVARACTGGAGVLAWAWGVLLAAGAGFLDGTPGQAGALLAAAVAAAGVTVAARASSVPGALAAGAASGAGLLAVAVAADAQGGLDLLLPVVLAASALPVVLAGFLPEAARRALLAVGGSTAGLAALPSVVGALSVLLAPLGAAEWSMAPGERYGDVVGARIDAALPWSRPLEALLAGVVLALAARYARPRHAAWPLAAGAALAAVLGLVAWPVPVGGLPAVGAVAAAVLAVALTGRPSPAAASAAGAVLLATLTGSLLAPVTTVAGLAVVLAAAGAVARGADERLRPQAVGVAAAAALGLALVVPPALGAGWPVGGLCGLLAAGVCAVLAGVHAPARERAVVEAVAVAAALVGLAVAGREPAYLSPALALAGAGLAAVAARPDRRSLGWPALGVLLLAVESRLAYVGVEAVEMYSLPAAVALLGAGALARHRARGDDAPGSWTAYGPGLLLGLVPSLALIGGPGVARPVLLALAAFAAVLVGLHRRLQAPLLVGAGVLAVDAVAQLAPYAPAVPRWAVLGLLGVALLVVGASYERRVTQLRTAARALATFG